MSPRGHGSGAYLQGGVGICGGPHLSAECPQTQALQAELDVGPDALGLWAGLWQLLGTSCPQSRPQDRKQDPRAAGGQRKPWGAGPRHRLDEAWQEGP